MRVHLLLLLSLFALVVFACGDDDGFARCSVSTDCPDAQVCVSNMCTSPDAGPLDGGTDGGGDTPRDTGRCESRLFCGSPPVCCPSGDECIDGACIAACESGTRCGTTCCGDGQACVNRTCEALRGECSDSYDCEPGEYCETTLGRCLPQPAEVTCSVVPEFETFDPVEEWSTAGTTFAEYPEAYRSVVNPVVLDFSGDGVPEIVASFFLSGQTECRGVIRMLDGRDGTVRWSIRDLAGSTVSACPTNAGADLDLDGTAELIGVLHDGRLFALRGDGTLLWTSVDSSGNAYSLPDNWGGGQSNYFLNYANAAIAVGDLIPGGGPEIAIGGAVFNAAGVHLFNVGRASLEGDNNRYAGGLPLIADIDMDGVQELVTGARAWENDGTMIWEANVVMGEDGYPAVGNFDSDPQPEVVLVSSAAGTPGSVRLIDGVSGTTEWGPVAIPGGGRGGPPTVADFDGDGQPEIGVAGASNYAVFDPTGENDVLWSQATQDQSSNATGSAVFDFEGDGAAEVVYGDECFIRAYRGATGEELFALPNASGTQHEYPITADVDGDGNTEIVFIANGSPGGGSRGCDTYPGWDGAERFGVYVFGSESDVWVRTRRIWNQHTYHVTHTTAAGQVVSSPPNNWETDGLNNFRQNSPGEGVFNAPDLRIAGLSVVLSGCPREVTVQARVENIGNLGVPAGVTVTFENASTGELIGTGMTTEALLPGQSTIVEIMAPVPMEGALEVRATVDGDGQVVECNDMNNQGQLGDIECSLLQ